MKLELPVVELGGACRQMGENFGEACREDIQKLYQLHMDWTLYLAAQAGRHFTPEQALHVGRECLLACQTFDPLGYEEFCGIARGAALTPEQLLTGHMTDFVDTLVFGGVWQRCQGCSSAIITRERSLDNKLLLGQTFDWITDDLPFVRLVHRRPEEGPETWALTLAGSLSLCGINSSGIAIGITKLLTWDARIGVPCASIVHRALRADKLTESAQIIEQANRAAAHYYYLGDATGQAVVIECSATRSARTICEHGYFVHCNHALDQEIRKLENCPADASTGFRQQRLSQLLSKHDKISVPDLQRMFADRKGGELGIRQENTLGIYSNIACIIFSPENGEIHACLGQADVGQWVTRRFIYPGA